MPQQASAPVTRAAMERAGRILMVHENFRWQKAFRLLRAEIDAGEQELAPVRFGMEGGWCCQPATTEQ